MKLFNLLISALLTFIVVGLFVFFDWFYIAFSLTYVWVVTTLWLTLAMVEWLLYNKKTDSLRFGKVAHKLLMVVTAGLALYALSGLTEWYVMPNFFFVGLWMSLLLGLARLPLAANADKKIE